MPSCPTFLLATGYINLWFFLLVSFRWEFFTFDIKHRVPVRTLGEDITSGCTQSTGGDSRWRICGDEPSCLRLWLLEWRPIGCWWERAENFGEHVYCLREDTLFLCKNCVFSRRIISALWRRVCFIIDGVPNVLICCEPWFDLVGFEWFGSVLTCSWILARTWRLRDSLSSCRELDVH